MTTVDDGVPATVQSLLMFPTIQSDNFNHWADAFIVEADNITNADPQSTK